MYLKTNVFETTSESRAGTNPKIVINAPKRSWIGRTERIVNYNVNKEMKTKRLKLLDFYEQEAKLLSL